jgi:hypothetical protein
MFMFKKSFLLLPVVAIIGFLSFSCQRDDYAVYAVVVSSPASASSVSGGGDYMAGDVVHITAGVIDGRNFVHWSTTSPGVVFASDTGAVTSFIMPANHVAVRAVFERESEVYAVIVSSPATSGVLGSGDYLEGDTVFVRTGDIEGRRFSHWTSTSPNVEFIDPQGALTSFIMPANHVAVRAVFEGGAETYAVIVSSPAESGVLGGGDYLVGELVQVMAGDIEGRRFIRWESESPGVSFTNPVSILTTFNMPTNHVLVRAVFEEAYTVIVSSRSTGALGSGDYYEGDTVRIYAGETNDSLRFSHWETLSQEIVFANDSSTETSFIMTDGPVAVRAVFVYPDGKAFVRFTWEKHRESTSHSAIFFIVAGYEDVKALARDLEILWDGREYVRNTMGGTITDTTLYAGTLAIKDSIFVSSLHATNGSPYKGAYFEIDAGSYTAILRQGSVSGPLYIVANYHIIIDSGTVLAPGVNRFFEVAFDFTIANDGLGWSFYEHADSTAPPRLE